MIKWLICKRDAQSELGEQQADALRGGYYFEHFERWESRDLKKPTGCPQIVQLVNIGAGESNSAACMPLLFNIYQARFDYYNVEQTYGWISQQTN